MRCTVYNSGKKRKGLSLSSNVPVVSGCAILFQVVSAGFEVGSDCFRLIQVIFRRVLFLLGCFTLCQFVSGCVKLFWLCFVVIGVEVVHITLVKLFREVKWCQVGNVSEFVLNSFQLFNILLCWFILFSVV